MTDPHIPRQWDPDTMTDAEIAAVMGHIAERFERAAHPPGPDPDAAAPPPEAVPLQVDEEMAVLAACCHAAEALLTAPDYDAKWNPPAWGGWRFPELAALGLQCQFTRAHQAVTEARLM